MKKKANKKSFEIINPYEKIPRKYKITYYNPNYDKHGIEIPFRILLAGSSGSGKGMTLVNLLKALTDTFDTLTIIAKKPNQPIFKYLSDIIKDEKDDDKKEDEKKRMILLKDTVYQVV